MTVVLDGVAGVLERVGADLGSSAWHDVTQERIDAFAASTGDDQWIHVDAERAAASDFGTTIAHGLYTLSLGPLLTNEVFEVVGFAFGLNYGYDRVRFPAPLPTGSRVRLHAALVRADEVAGGVQLVVRQTFEREGAPKPVCVSDALSRWLL
jgi:acyl dehydratase